MQCMPLTTYRIFVNMPLKLKCTFYCGHGALLNSLIQETKNTPPRSIIQLELKPICEKNNPCMKWWHWEDEESASVCNENCKRESGGVFKRIVEI